MVGDVIDTFRNTTLAVKQKFVLKSQIEVRTCVTGSHSQKLDISIMSFQPFCCLMLRKFAPENEHVPAKKEAVFERLY